MSIRTCLAALATAASVSVVGCAGLTETPEETAARIEAEERIRANEFCMEFAAYRSGYDVEIRSWRFMTEPQFAALLKTMGENPVYREEFVECLAERGQ